jgi:hypothetical protein
VLTVGATWSTGYVGNVSPGGNTAQAQLFDTVTFENVPADATAQLNLDESLAISSDGLVGATSYLQVSGGSINPYMPLLSTESATSSSVYLDGVPLAGWSPFSLTFPILAGTPYVLLADCSAVVDSPNLYSPDMPPPGVVFGAVGLDPNWSLIVPDGVTYTTASGIPIGGAAPEPSTFAMQSAVLALLSLRAARARRCSSRSSRHRVLCRFLASKFRTRDVRASA